MNNKDSHYLRNSKDLELLPGTKNKSQPTSLLQGLEAISQELGTEAYQIIYYIGIYM